MYKELDSSALMASLIGEKPSNKFRRYETVVKRITKIKTLIEDDSLLQKIVDFANSKEGNYCNTGGSPITMADAKSPNRSELQYYIKDDSTESGLRERWSTSRWEGDDCEPYFAGYEQYSFNEIIDDYIHHYPKGIRWKVKTKEERVR